MDFGYFENQLADPCDGLAHEEVLGYWLCAGCLEALELLAIIGGAYKRDQRSTG